MIGWLIIGIAACMSVLIVLVLVFHETEEKEEAPVYFGPTTAAYDLTPVYLKHEGERLPSHCSHFICNKCGQRVEKGAFNITQHTDNCPADLRQITSVFHGIVERAWQHRWTLDNYDKVHITLKREVTSGKAEVMNVYWNTKEEAYTVQTTVNHPKSGRKQLNRRGLNQEDVFRLLEHPRAHTDKGYYKK